MKLYVPLVASAFAYIVALFLPALYGGGSHVIGFVLLVLGWVQSHNGECCAWFANPVFFAGFFAFALRRFKVALCCAALACLIGLDTFRATVFSLNEAGNDVAIEHVGAAFYVWQLSFIVLLLASIRMMSIGRSPTPSGDAA